MIDSASSKKNTELVHMIKPHAKYCFVCFPQSDPENKVRVAGYCGYTKIEDMT